MTPKKIKTSLKVFIACCGTSSLLVLWLGLTAPVATPADDEPSSRNTIRTSAPLAEGELPTLTMFGAAASLSLTQPLYDPPPPPPKRKPLPPSLRLELIGIFLEESGDTAVLRASDGKIHYLSKGQTLDKATILTIDKNQITVQYHGVKRELKLKNS